jgi:hypothetical protein
MVPTLLRFLETVAQVLPFQLQDHPLITVVVAEQELRAQQAQDHSVAVMVEILALPQQQEQLTQVAVVVAAVLHHLKQAQQVDLVL